MKPLLAAIGFLVFLAAPASAQILKYVDAHGVTHFVQSPDQIPEQYRGKIEVPKNLPPVTAVESNLPKNPAKQRELPKSVMPAPAAPNAAQTPDPYAFARWQAAERIKKDKEEAERAEQERVQREAEWREDQRAREQGRETGRQLYNCIRARGAC